eukprot:4281334-Lingulodinium_polyedra.AAC.1
MLVYPSASVAMPRLRRAKSGESENVRSAQTKWAWTWTQSVWPRRVSSKETQKCTFRLDEMIV